MEKGLLRVLIAGLVFFGWQQTSKGQNFAEIYSIFQTNCTNTTCHNGGQPTIDFSGSMTDVYNGLLNTSPVNPAASGKGNKLVDPGHPYNSFLLRKIGADFDSYFDLQPAEGNRMPSNGAPALDDYEIELVRQWILAGAGYATSDVDTSILHQYYTNGGIQFITPPPAPHPDSGFQIRLGPIFIEPNQPGNTDEVEYLKKQHLPITADKEVYRIDGMMNNQSHHFLLFMFNSPQAAAQEDDGLRLVNIFNTATDGDKELQAAWQYNRPFILPQGTSFFYDQDDWLDMNYHVKNYSYDSILPVDFYLNVWMKDRGSGDREMKAELVNNGSLFLLPGSNSESYDHDWGGLGRNLWMISSHTHKYGTDFDIYKKNANGSRGEQFYEGFFNATYDFNQGYYDWEHPAVREFDTLYHIAADEGMELVTDWNVTQSTPVFFGLTTNDEMQLATYLYVDDVDTTISIDPARTGPVSGLWVYPVPARENARVAFELGQAADVSLEALDVMGKKHFFQENRFYSSGKHTLQLDVANLPAGVYFIRLRAGDQEMVRKITVLH